MKIVALAGGVGGARLAQGLAQLGHNLTLIVNTGDDFDHLGLRICPDLDTVLYTLAGIANRDQGWGLADETGAAMQQIRRLGGEDWFLLGDKDLAIHILRSARLARQEPLSAITADFARKLGITARILPMSDDPVATKIHSTEGILAFQDWFVARRAAPAVNAITFAGLAEARPAPGLRAALRAADLIVICPSNPFLSIDPILGLADLAEIIAARRCVAVSPIIAGKAVKGPAADLMRALGFEVSALGIARKYGSLIKGMVIDDQDRHLCQALDMPAIAVQSLMRSDAERRAVAQACLALAEAL